MRPIQWHLKNNWRVPESLEKVIPIPRSLHPHLQWWLQEDNVLTGQPLHPIKQIFTDASKEGWGAHLNERTARGTWSLPESKLHINYLEVKAVLGQTIQTEWSLLQEVFQAICSRWHWPQIDLFATRFNNMLPLFVSPVPDSLATAVDAHGRIWMHMPSHQQPSWAKWWRSCRTPHARESF